MPKRSAGLLTFRTSNDQLEVFLVHPGGPLWAKKDKGAWTIPKGEYEQDENPLVAARREFEEETGFQAIGEFVDLGSIKQKSGKVVFLLVVGPRGGLTMAIVILSALSST
ncbi:MAG TPA: NUDIX domain-containing protein [Edaphobacter sp.]|nr:NUDIX domain-containing protein [Edaphobacter sp.]